MNQLWTEIIHNICTVLALLLMYSFAATVLDRFNKGNKTIAGLIFGVFAVFAMMTPFKYNTGLIFDARSVVLFTAGIGCSFPGTLIAIFIAGIYRSAIGGVGAGMGIYTIVTSALLGYTFNYLRTRKPYLQKYLYIYIAGFINHVVMLSGAFLLPEDVRYTVLINITLPVLAIYPFATLIFVVILDHQIDMKKQYDDLIESRKKLKSVLFQTLNAISKAIESKDKYTREHQQRVANISAKIAEKLNWQPDKIIGLYIAAAVHDIGKIAIPLTILNKIGKLSEEEYSVVKTHSMEGYEIFNQLKYPWPIDKIILQHHERLDGSGYPLGIKGDKIYEEAKIIAVADSFDAMTSDRPYRKGMSVQKALEVLMSESGIKLDENYVTTCIKIIESGDFEILEIPETVFSEIKQQ